MLHVSRCLAGKFAVNSLEQNETKCRSFLLAVRRLVKCVSICFQLKFCGFV